MSETVSAAMRRATAHLRGKSESPELDAGILLAHTLNTTRSWLVAHGAKPLDAASGALFDQVVERRRRGEPVAYLTGTKEFWSLPLAVSPQVLVPRPETEILVEAALECLAGDNLEGSVVDLGTGSGAIALALAKEHPALRIVATDISAQALDIARGNAQRLKLTNVEFRQGHWFAALPRQRYRMICANPPYVASDDPQLAALEHEPRQALVAADNGRCHLRQLVEQAATYLVAWGWLLLEHGAGQDFFVRRTLETHGFTTVETLPDLAGLPRVTRGRLRPGAGG